MKFIWRWIEQDRNEHERLRRGELDDDLCGPDPARLISRWILLGAAPFVPVMAADQLGWLPGSMRSLFLVLACLWFFVAIGLMLFSQWRSQEP